MNVTVEHLASCKKLMRVEVETSAVDAAFEEVTKDFMKFARIPGFRPGKAPRHLVAKAFSSEIENEVRRKLLGDSFRKAAQEKNFRVVGQPDIEEVQFGRSQPLQFTATLEVAPEIELGEYTGIPVKREVRTVTAEDVDRAINLLLEKRSTYVDVSRPVQAGDFVVVNYKGTIDGKAIGELAPSAQGLGERQDFWVQVTADGFLPGFAEQLVGANGGETKSISVTFPGNIGIPELAGRIAQYEVQVVQVKEKVLPELNDELAKAYGAESVEQLRDGVRRDLENELSFKQKRSVRDQIVRELLQRITCELPESLVVNETRHVVYDVVRENQERGISREVIDQQKEQIFSYASNSARDRVKAAFILGKIAEKEGIKVEPKEVEQRIFLLAHQYQIKPDRLARQLHERDGFAEIREQIITTKVLDFLEKGARIEDVLPPGGTPA